MMADMWDLVLVGEWVDWKAGKLAVLLGELWVEVLEIRLVDWLANTMDGKKER